MRHSKRAALSCLAARSSALTRLRRSHPVRALHCSQVLDTFLLQRMTTGVLHCDPRPGNMCVTPEGKIVMYDFGMMDTLTNDTVAGMRKIAFGLLNGSPDPSDAEITTRGDSVMEGLEMAGFLTPGANATAVRRVGEFLVRFFSDQAAGRATQDVTEQVDYELRSLLDGGAIAFHSAFSFVARAFASIDGIAKSLRPGIQTSGNLAFVASRTSSQSRWLRVV